MTTWTDPRTWNIGELVTKAIMDTHVRDNLKHLKEQVTISLENSKVVLLTNPLNNASYVGGAKTVGTYTHTANGFNPTIPAGAKALLVTLSAKWAAASDSNYCNVTNADSGSNCVVVRALVANLFGDATGIVTLNAAGEFKVVVTGANATSLILNVWGYII